MRMIEDRAGVVWVASGRDGLAYVDRRRNCLTFLSLAAGRETELRAWALIEDRDGLIWVGTEHGLLQLDAGRTRFVRYRSDPADPESLPADWVLGLFEDREDGLWVGTANGGVAPHIRASAAVQPLPARTPAGRIFPARTTCSSPTRTPPACCGRERAAQSTRST